MSVRLTNRPSVRYSRTVLHVRPIVLLSFGPAAAVWHFKIHIIGYLSIYETNDFIQSHRLGNPKHFLYHILSLYTVLWCLAKQFHLMGSSMKKTPDPDFDDISIIEPRRRRRSSSRQRRNSLMSMFSQKTVVRDEFRNAVRYITWLDRIVYGSDEFVGRMDSAGRMDQWVG